MDKLAVTPTRRMLTVRLNEQQINRAAMAAAQYAQQYQEVEDEKKDLTAEFTGRLKTLRGAIKDRSQVATSGEEVQPVECEWTIFREDCKKRLYRLDTGEMVEEADLTQAEMQTAFLNE